jgi:histone deacetylase 11
VASGISDKAYLDLVRQTVPAAMDDFQPDLVIYNAGTDPYEEDALGRMQVSEAALILRDQCVFEAAFDRKVPIAMLLSGGYSRHSGLIVGRSIHNLLGVIDKREGLQRFH